MATNYKLSKASNSECWREVLKAIKHITPSENYPGGGGSVGGFQSLFEAAGFLESSYVSGNSHNASLSFFKAPETFDRVEVEKKVNAWIKENPGRVSITNPFSLPKGLEKLSKVVEIQPDFFVEGRYCSSTWWDVAVKLLFQERYGVNASGSFSFKEEGLYLQKEGEKSELVLKREEVNSSLKSIFKDTFYEGKIKIVSYFESVTPEEFFSNLEELGKNLTPLGLSGPWVINPGI